MLKKFLNSKTTTIASAAVVLGAASLVGKIFGLLRERILLGTFGAGRELDIYYAAFRIPDFFYAFFVLGVVSAGFVPVFIGYRNKKEEQNGWRLANSVLNLTGLVMAAVSFLLIIFVPYLIRLVAPGFSAEEIKLAVKLTRLISLSPLLLGVSAVFGAILQSFRRFLAYSLAPILYDLGIIFGALVFVRYFGLIGLALGVLLGAFLHLMIHFLPSFFCGFRWRPVLDLKFEGMRRILKLAPPRIGGLIFYQTNLWIFTAIASLLAVGSISVFNAAYNVFYFPLSVFALSFAIAALPELSEKAQKKDKAGFVGMFSLTVRQILFFLLPVSALFMILRFQIVSVLFRSGKFSQASVFLTGQTLFYFCLGLFSEGLILLFLRGFFAWEDTMTPLVLAFFGEGGRVLFGWLLAKRLGVAGLGLGFSLGGLLFLILLFIFLRKKTGFLGIKKILTAGAKMLLASVFAGLAAYFSLRFLVGLIPGLAVSEIFIQGFLAGLAGVVVYLFFVWIFRVQELMIFFRSFCRRLPWKKVSAIGTETGE